MTGKSKAPQATLFLLLLLSFALNAWAAPRVKSKLAKKPKVTQTKCSRTTDADIVNAVKKKFQADPDIAKQMRRINVDSKRRVVRLEGWLDDEKLIAKAATLARTTKCVKRVVGVSKIRTTGVTSCGPGQQPCCDTCIAKTSTCHCGN